VIGRSAVRALCEAGHQVRTTARGEENTRLARGLGAERVAVDLYLGRHNGSWCAGCMGAIKG
jgi:uncharacterized protein YbjT (DUF2867 family)